MIRAADEKSLSAISNEMRSLAERARDKKLKPEEYQGGVSAISNLGMYGVREFSAIINPPQSSILAVGAAQRRPVETEDGGVRFESQMTVTLSCDHRVIDGALGAQLLAALKGYLEQPVTMLVYFGWMIVDQFAFLTFAMVLLVAVISPGPAIAALVARIMARGTDGIAAFCAGLVLGDLIWLVLRDVRAGGARGAVPAGLPDREILRGGLSAVPRLEALDAIPVRRCRPSRCADRDFSCSARRCCCRSAIRRSCCSILR